MQERGSKRGVSSGESWLWRACCGLWRGFSEEGETRRGGFLRLAGDEEEGFVVKKEEMERCC